MKVRLQAGAELDLLNSDELGKTLDKSLRSWTVELGKGVRPIKFTGQATIGQEVAGTVKLGGDSIATNAGRLGPEAGFVWAVRRLAVRGINPAAESLSLYLNNESPAALVRDSITTYVSFFTGELTVQGPETLMLVGNSLASTGQVIVSGAALAFPVGLMWKLL